MWFYWFLFVITAWMALHSYMKTAPSEIIYAKWSFAWSAIFLTLTLAVGLRHEVGADWFQYQAAFDFALLESLETNISVTDPAYALLNWLGGNMWGGIYFVNLICGLFFSWGLMSFCITQPSPWLALLVAVPYLITVVSMGYTRQGVAIGIALLGMLALLQGSLFRFILWMGLAAAFHKSAVILIPLAVFARSRNSILTLVNIVFATTLLFILLLQESVDHLYQGYIVAEYESSGAAVRVAMNALPAALFILYRKRFNLNESEKKFWTAISFCALMFIVLLHVSPSSTAVDRLSLYWIPLQLFVWSRLPDVIGRSRTAKKVLVFLVITYCAVIHFVWLNFSPHSVLWIPYKFYPWEWIWS